MIKFLKKIITSIVLVFARVYSYKSNDRLSTFKFWLYSLWIKREFGKCGTRFIIKYPATVIGTRCIEIGNNFTSGSQLRLECLVEFAGVNYTPSLKIGDNVLMGNNNHIGCINKISIGNNVLIASNILITDHQHGFIDGRDVSLPPFQRPLQSSGAVVIEDNVWICENASILPGVTIGHGAIIGANAVVTKDVSPNTVVGGIPARVLKQLDATKYI